MSSGALTTLVLFLYCVPPAVHPQHVLPSTPIDLFKYEGECGEGSSLGVCKKVTECFKSNGDVISKNHHGLESCGHEDFIEIVCCPLNGNLGNEERKSEKACNDHKKTYRPIMNDRILGGDYAKMGEFPHMAILGYKYGGISELRWECGASLVSRKFLLTAAHCVERVDGLLPVKVRLGTTNKHGIDKIKPQDMDVKRIITNHEYLPRLKRNDLALIELDFEVSTNEYVHPACLHQNQTAPSELTATGWGLTSLMGNSSDILKKVVLETVPISNCSSYYQARSGRPILPTQICATSRDGAGDTCSGDSGGPLQIQESPNGVHTIVGVTSYGVGCGGRRPGVYARVASYINWIERIVWP